MIRGTVTDDGTPTILLPVAGRDWVVVIDTGFNGGLELPEPLRPHVNARFTARTISDHPARLRPLYQ